MTREELLQIAKPILFTTEMVRAILDDKKTETRRVLKLKYENTHHEMKTDKYGTRLIEIEDDVEGVTFGRREDGTTWRRLRGYIEPKPPYKNGDILYVRETWQEYTGGYLYRAWPEGIHQPGTFAKMPWRPSIHMPKDAARIFLKVINVHVERLQVITEEQAKSEGAIDNRRLIHSPDNEYDRIYSAKEDFKRIWNSTIKKKDMDKYGWNANPWVWVIKFNKMDMDHEI